MVKQIKYIAILLFLTQISVKAQDFRYGYLVEFTNKENSPYSIDQPEAFLSERAIERRLKWNIEISDQDLPVNPQYIDSVKQYQGVFHVSSKWLNSAVFYTESHSFDEEVAALDFVSNVQLVYEQLPIVKSATKSKWVNNTSESYYGNAYNQMSMLNAQELHHRNYWGKGIHIAVLDGGFWRVDEIDAFKSLWNNGQILGTYDYVSHDNNVFNDHSHGTSVLSTMASNLPGEMVGGAPLASYYLFRTENVYTEYLIEEENWIAGAEKADSVGADIITASLGYSTYDNPDMNHNYADMDGKSTRITRGAEIAFSKGMFLINSAGNEGNSSWNYITAPSDGEHVLCIGAVDSAQNLALFSSRGPSFDNRTKPDVVSQGLKTALILSDGSVGTSSGTSFSCPVMAGMVACLWQALPNYSNQNLLDLIRKISDRYETPDNNYGYGLPDFSKVALVVDAKEYERSLGDELVTVFPNPFTSTVNFNLFLNKTQFVKVQLVNMQGCVIYEKSHFLNNIGTNKMTIPNLDELNNGCYLLKVTTETQAYTKQIMRN